MPKGFVKIMLSYDYCHFEVALGDDNEEKTLQEIDELRKDCQRLADKAVEQFKLAKRIIETSLQREKEFEYLSKNVEIINKKPVRERTAQEKAVMKVFKDRQWKAYIESKYDYDDDFDEEWFDENNC